MDIFISYSRADRERVAHIAAALEAEGYSVWWDRDIRAGEEFDEVIDKAIKQSKAIVVVWSKTSITSNWVKEEAEDGVLANTLVPLMIDFVTIPRGFRRIQAAELHDAHDNPTLSENWPEFLGSIRKQVGNGEGADKSRRPPEPEVTSSAATDDAGPPPSFAAANPASAPSWKRYLPLGAGALAVLVAGIFAFQFLGLGGRAAPPPPEDMTPIVLGIYPDEGFGLDQAHGLKAAFNDTPSIIVRDLAAPLDAMKGRNAPELIEGLKTFLETRNVIAIVGPSITEFTPEVLSVVEQSGRNPAIILTTAASRRDIGWDNSELPLFRVGSGVDERADQFARLATNTIASGVELVLLYETKPNEPDQMTYGQLFYRQITERLPQWQQWSNNNQVRSISYTRGRIMDSFSRPRLRGLFDQNKMIIVVGLSSDYKDLVENFYRGEDRSRTAILGGWNTSKAVRELSAEINIQHTRLFDMTDVYRSPADVNGLPDARRFQEEFGPLTPALRQEAVAYDSGLVIKQAISQMEGEVTAEQLVAIMRGQRFNGITGEITFTGTGENWGQNRGTAGGMRPLYNLRYNPGETNWTEIESFDALLRTTVAAN